MKKILCVLPILSILTISSNAQIEPLVAGATIEWLAIYALAIIAIIILFLSSRRMAKVKKLHNEMLEKKKQMEQMEQSQNVFLANMSESIYDIAEKKFNEDSDLDVKSGVLDDCDGEENSNKLLDVTADLIEFLRLKSRKVDIENEPFIISNVLNEVAGFIGSSFKGSDVELIFDIDNNVPRNLIGDSLKLEKILRNFLEFIIREIASKDSYANGEVKLSITMIHNKSNKVELQFDFTDTSTGISKNELESLFTPNYDEDIGEYTGLGLFVARELIQILGGELAVQSIVGKGNEFTVVLPFEIAYDFSREYNDLPDEVLMPKKVFIVDNNYSSALAIKKMFSTFSYTVKVASKEEFMKTHYSLEAFDIIMLDIELFNHKTINYLNSIKDDLDLRIIALTSLLNRDENKAPSSIVDRVLSKPLNPDRISEMLIEVYDENRARITTTDTKQVKSNQDIAKRATLSVESDIVATKGVTQEYFSDFSGMSLLIVEDNIINQKVLVNILSKSGIVSKIANNGQEAMDLLHSDIDGYDIVLMDINMPVMDGYRATELIREDSRFDKLPIVAFTALSLDSEKRKILNCGMNAYLTKPLEIAKLYSAFKIFYANTNTDRLNKTKEHTDNSITASDTLDVEDGVRYSNDNHGFYIEILREFVDAYGDSGLLLEELVQKNELKKIELLCFDMKGLTATIGATNMHELTMEMHRHIINQNTKPIGIFLRSYQDELAKLIKSIKDYL